MILNTFDHKSNVVLTLMRYRKDNNYVSYIPLT